MSDLIKIEEFDLIEIFTGGGVEALVEAVRKNAIVVSPDVSTQKGRKAIASMAYKVAKTKTAVDRAGKDLVAEKKKVIKKVDQVRKFARDELDKIRDDVRRPLTEWEEEEKARIAAEEERKRLEEEERQRKIEEELERQRAEILQKQEEIRKREARVEAEKQRLEREEQIRKEEKAKAEAELALQLEKEKVARLQAESEASKHTFTEEDVLDIVSRIIGAYAHNNIQLAMEMAKRLIKEKTE